MRIVFVKAVVAVGEIFGLFGAERHAARELD